MGRAWKLIGVGIVVISFSFLGWGQSCPTKWSTEGTFPEVPIPVSIHLPACPIQRPAPYCTASDRDRSTPVQMSLNQYATELLITPGKTGAGDAFEVECVWNPAKPASTPHPKYQRPWKVYGRNCIDGIELTNQTELVVPVDSKGHEHPEQARVLNNLVKYHKECKDVHWMVMTDQKENGHD